MFYDKNEMNAQKYRLLKQFFGHESFRSGQEELADSILSGRDAVGIMPTGAGKSVCYQLPALMLGGITIVISPLISLMKDQVNSLIQSGVGCAYINSSLTRAQYETAMSRAAQGAYKIIYAAPERLDSPSFKNFAQSANISLIAVDEAHCVSQWGQDFRPSYLKIREFCESLPRRPVVAAFTATATAAVKRDIINMLGLRDPYSVTTGFDRKNLYFAVSEPKDKLAETERLIRAAGEASGIVYCSTRKNTELVCDYLNEHGLPCTRYHAGLSDEERRRNQDDFIYDRVRIMAATNAFGMGIDKSNVSFVIHYNMPKNLESYYQEAGRAGRDGSEAVCTLLFARKDVQTCRFLIENSSDSAELDDETARRLKERDYKRLNDMVRYCTGADCLRHYILNYFGEKSGTMCAKCSNCAAGFESEDVTLAAQKILSCVYRLAQRNLQMNAAAVAEILRGAKTKRIKQFNLEDLSTYGIAADLPALKIRAIIEELCGRGYMRRGDFESLILTNKARGVLFEGEHITMNFKRSTAGSEISAVSRRAAAETAERPELFSLLRQLRTKLAEEAEVPAYIIFSDATLRDMCRRLPTTEEDFMQVSGVGKSKTERYGAAFTAEIARWMEENGVDRSQADTDGAAVALDRRRKSQKPSAKSKAYKTGKSSKSGKSSGGENAATKRRYSSPKLLSEISAEQAARLGLSPELAAHAIEAYLLLGGYLERRGGELRVTPRGGLHGIAMSTKCESGSRTTVIEYKAAAQRLIDEHIDEIFR